MKLYTVIWECIQKHLPKKLGQRKLPLGPIPFCLLLQFLSKFVNFHCINYTVFGDPFLKR